MAETNVPPFDSPIAPRIQEALRRHAYERREDLTWKELGRRVWEDALHDGPVAKSKLSLIKNGTQAPDSREGAAIAFVLDCSPMWLVWGYGEMGRFPREEALTLAAEAVAQRAVDTARQSYRDVAPRQAHTTRDHIVPRKRDEPKRKRRGA